MRNAVILAGLLICSQVAWGELSWTVTVTQSFDDFDEEHPGNECLISYIIRNTSSAGDANNLISYTVPAGTNQGVYIATKPTGWISTKNANDTRFDGNGNYIPPGNQNSFRLYSYSLHVGRGTASAVASDDDPFPPLTVEVPTEVPEPGVGITNVGGSVTAAYGTVAFELSGTNNEWVAGTMVWTNALGGAWGAFPAAANWQFTATNLQVGTNAIAVIGTNAVNVYVATAGVEIVRMPKFFLTGPAALRETEPGAYAATYTDADNAWTDVTAQAAWSLPEPFPPHSRLDGPVFRAGLLPPGTNAATARLRAEYAADGTTATAECAVAIGLFPEPRALLWTAGAPEERGAVRPFGYGPSYVEPDATVTARAEAVAYWHFAGWTGDVVSADNPLALTVATTRTVVATFAPNLTARGVPEEWLAGYDLADDEGDPDGDGPKTWQEWWADTNPTTNASCLRLAAPTEAGLAWTGGTGAWQQLEYAPDAAGDYAAVWSNPPPNDVTNSWPAPAAGFYRLRAWREPN